MTKYKYLLVPSLLVCIVPDVDVEPTFFPCYFLFLRAVQSWFSSGWDLGPVLLVGMGWLQGEGGLKITAKPVNNWTCSMMQNHTLPSASAGRRERIFPPVTSGQWSLWDLITKMSLGHPIFTDLFRTSTIAAGSNLDSQFKSYFSISVFKKPVILVSLVSNLNHMRKKSKQHSGSQTRQAKLIFLFGSLAGVFFLVFDFDLQSHFTDKEYFRPVAHWGLY